MMKKHSSLLFLLFLFFMMPLATTAQRAKLKIADKHYKAFDYITAAEVYQDILSNEKWAKDTLVLRRIAESELKTGQWGKAEGHLRILAGIPDVRVSDLLALADVLKFQGKYADAQMVYEQIVSSEPGNTIARAHTENPDYAKYIMRDSSIYTLKNSSINSSSSDFAPGFFEGSKIIFASARGEGAGGKKFYNWNQQPYLNVYTSGIMLDSTLSGATLMSSTINSRFHEGTMTYDVIGKTMYITRNNYVSGKRNKSESGQLNLGIFTTKYNSDGTWESLESFPHNSPENSLAHPALNDSRNRIYFTSDMKGGKGGTDIWYSEWTESSWGAPKNLADVNTPGNEMFPFMVADSILYFSSDGHVGLGGLDMFFTDLSSAEPKIRNMGYPANSHYDDFGVICFKNETTGYFTSNRPGGKGYDDIWEFKLHPPDSVNVTGLVTDELSMLPVSKALVTIENPDGSVLQTLTDDQGAYTLRSPWKTELIIGAEKKDYIPNTITATLDPRSTVFENANIPLRKLEFAIQGKVLYSENNQPAVGATVNLMDAQENVLESSKIGNDGKYIFPLETGKKYIVEASKEDYIKLSTEVSTINNPTKLMTYDFKLFKPEKGTVVRLDNIYYDYAKWDIRPDAAAELYKLVRILQDNPTMIIELSSHTDSRGSDSYNLGLSDKRANSAVKYIISQGIDKSRLVAKGYGETKLLNTCKDDVDCTDEEHQYNRRTEFKILDI